MDQSAIYGQQDFNLPHDVVKLPSKGVFYKPKKESLKVGYLTAYDENILMTSENVRDGLVMTLLKNKIYEPGFDVLQLLDTDVQAILIFLRNTSFGSDYNYTIVDPATKKPFDITLDLSALDFKKPKFDPDAEGYFTYKLPKSLKEVKCKLLTVGETNELDRLTQSYPKGMVAPIITKRLEKQIISIDGEKNKEMFSQFINQMPISDSKNLRKFLRDCEPQIDLERTVTAPSGEKVTFEVAFGAEFFRPFFSL
jgi:hypothetical protein